jgi:hypothetical protein
LRLGGSIANIQPELGATLNTAFLLGIVITGTQATNLTVLSLTVPTGGGQFANITLENAAGTRQAIDIATDNNTFSNLRCGPLTVSGDNNLVSNVVVTSLGGGITVSGASNRVHNVETNISTIVSGTDNELSNFDAETTALSITNDRNRATNSNFNTLSVSGDRAEVSNSSFNTLSSATTTTDSLFSNLEFSSTGPHSLAITTSTIRNFIFPTNFSTLSIGGQASQGSTNTISGIVMPFGTLNIGFTAITIFSRIISSELSDIDCNTLVFQGSTDNMLTNIRCFSCTFNSGIGLNPTDNMFSNLTVTNTMTVNNANTQISNSDLNTLIVASTGINTIVSDSIIASGGPGTFTVNCTQSVFSNCIIETTSPVVIGATPNGSNNQFSNCYFAFISTLTVSGDENQFTGCSFRSVIMNVTGDRNRFSNAFGTFVGGGPTVTISGDRTMINGFSNARDVNVTGFAGDVQLSNIDIVSASASSHFDLAGASGVVMENCVTNGDIRVLTGTNTSKINITNCQARDLVLTSNNTLDNMVVDNCTFNGIINAFGAGVKTNVTITNCIAEFFGMLAPGGVALEGWNVSNNTFTGNNGTLGEAFDVNAANNSIFNNNKMDNGYMKFNVLADSVVDGNYVGVSGLVEGLTFEGTLSRSKILNNHLEISNMFFDNVLDSEICGNYVGGPSGPSMYFNGGAPIIVSNTKICENRIINGEMRFFNSTIVDRFARGLNVSNNSIDAIGASGTPGIIFESNVFVQDSVISGNILQGSSLIIDNTGSSNTGIVITNNKVGSFFASPNYQVIKGPTGLPGSVVMGNTIRNSTLLGAFPSGNLGINSAPTDPGISALLELTTNSAANAILP